MATGLELAYVITGSWAHGREVTTNTMTGVFVVEDAGVTPEPLAGV